MGVRVVVFVEGWAPTFFGGSHFPAILCLRHLAFLGFIGGSISPNSWGLPSFFWFKEKE